MTKTLFRGVRLLDLDLKDGMTATCDLRVSNGRITGIAKDLSAQPGEKVIEGAGNLLMPG